MRVLLLAVLTVLAVVYHGSQASAGTNSQGMLGRVLLRRALEAMASKPDQINVKRRSTEAEDSDDDEVKHTDAMEDIFVGSNSNEASGSRRSDVSSQTSDDEQSSSGSGESEANASSGTAEEQANDAETEISSSSQGSGDQTAETAQDQQQEADSGSSSSTIAAEEASPSEASDSGSASTVSVETPAEQAPQQATQQDTVQVADSNTANPNPNEPVTVTNKEAQSDVNAAKKSDIEVASGEASIQEKQDSSEESASGENEDVTSGQAAEVADVADEHDDGSAEAIKKGMESLTRLLKPVATGLDFQIYSGSSKPKEDGEEEEDETKGEEDEKKGEDETPVIKVIAKGESDKDEEEEHDVEKKTKEPAKVKKCETVCAIPLTYQQCAVPRCEHKIGSIKDLCYFLCEHQKPHCRQECKEV